jgi:hypothetical protein
MLKLGVCILTGCGIVGTATYLVVVVFKEDRQEQLAKEAEKKYFHWQQHKDKGNAAWNTRGKKE